MAGSGRTPYHSRKAKTCASGREGSRRRFSALGAGGLLALGLAGAAFGFHNGGVGECDGCHSMHSSYDGASGPGPEGSEGRAFVGMAGRNLLKNVDPSSACLNCHEHAGDVGPASYRISTAPNDAPEFSPPVQMSPGGDFAWLKKTYGWQPVAGGPLEQSLGERHGHNIIADSYGYSIDAVNTESPGGRTAGAVPYPAASLQCTSCHDPHGKYRRLFDGTVTTTGAAIADTGSYSDSPIPTPGLAVGTYRMLAGVGYQPRSLVGSLAFSAGPPVAVAPRDYNRSEASAETRVAYGQGMSEWCANCHGLYHAEGSGSAFEHPVGRNENLSDVVNTYNTYIKTGDLTGLAATAYASLVPFEEGTADIAVLAQHANSSGTFREGPQATANLSCLTCHRAHASGWDYALRWNMRGKGLATGSIVVGGTWPGINATGDAALPVNAQGRTQAETQAAMYGRPATTYSPYETVLCNKCHNGATP